MNPPSFEVLFNELSLDNPESDRSFNGWWPEQRPLPEEGDVFLLIHPDLGVDAHKAKVLRVEQFYFPQGSFPAYGSEKSLPGWSRTAVIYIELQPLTAEERAKKPALYVVPSRIP